MGFVILGVLQLRGGNMVDKFKAGDHIINDECVIWRVTDFTDGVITGIVVQHPSREWIGELAIDAGADGDVEFEWEVLCNYPSMEIY